MERIAVGEDTGLGGFRLQNAQRFGVLGQRMLALECGGRDRNERAEHHGSDGDAELCHCPLHPRVMSGSHSLAPKSFAHMSLSLGGREKVQIRSRSTGNDGETMWMTLFSLGPQHKSDASGMRAPRWRHEQLEQANTIRCLWRDILGHGGCSKAKTQRVNVRTYRHVPSLYPCLSSARSGDGELSMSRAMIRVARRSTIICSHDHASFSARLGRSA